MLVALFCFACAGNDPAPPPAGSVAPASVGSSRKIDVATLRADLDAHKVPVLVDVRTPGEFAGGHVAGAVNVPVGDLSGRLGELEAFRGGEVYVICEVGGRSASATRELERAGFHAVDVGGGTAAWRGAGFPTE